MRQFQRDLLDTRHQIRIDRRHRLAIKQSFAGWVSGFIA